MAMPDAFFEGTCAQSLYDNPYWKEYPEKKCSETEQINARHFVDGYFYARYMMKALAYGKRMAQASDNAR